MDWFSFYDENFFSFVPLLSLIPYIFLKKIFIHQIFLVRATNWIYSFFILDVFYQPLFRQKILFFYLVEKFNSLSSKNTFTNPFYYYFWNVPVTFLPWSFFAIIGTTYNIFQSKENKYILAFFPLILVATLSIFSTKTPYYPLQISSIFSLNTYVGIKYLFNSYRYSRFFIFMTSK